MVFNESWNLEKLGCDLIKPTDRVKYFILYSGNIYARFLEKREKKSEAIIQKICVKNTFYYYYFVQ